MATRTKKDNTKQLITDATLLSLQIKTDTKELAEDKELLIDWYEALGVGAEKDHEGFDGTKATFSESDVFEPISIEALNDMLTMQGKADKLHDCLAVNMTLLRKILGAEDIKTLQGESTATKYSIRLTVSKEK